MSGYLCTSRSKFIGVHFKTMNHFYTRMATKSSTTSELIDINKTHILNLLQFLDKYKWIWDVKMTDIFLLDHFTNIPSEVNDHTTTYVNII